MFLIADYVVFAVVVVAAVFVVVVAAAEFDVVISAVAAVFFHLVVVLVLFVHSAVVASDFENDDGDFAVACRLHLTVLVGLEVFI